VTLQRPLPRSITPEDVRKRRRLGPGSGARAKARR
jgi:hypothetical protein